MRLATRIALSTTFAVSTALAACTETPSFLPECVDPNHPCPAFEAGADASDAGADAPVEANAADAP